MKINKDTIYLLIIVLILILGFIFLKNNIYFPLADIGREFFIPSEMAKGEVLYRDIFCIYPPAAYYFNALIVKIFGNSLNVFYYVGFLLSLSSLIAIYYILKFYTDKVTALLSTVFIIVSCTFYPSISNWITPYSYSIMYALSSILWALYFLIKYFDEEKKSFLYFAVLLYGLSVCCKYEYVLFILAILFVLIKKKTCLTTVFKSFLILLTLPVIMFFIMLILQVTTNDLSQMFKYAVELAQSTPVKYFYSFSGLTFNLTSIKSALISLYNPHFVTLFYSLSLISIITPVFIRNPKLLLLNISAIAVTFKSLGGISFEIYGTYFFPVLFILVVSILYSKINKKLLVSAIAVLILSYSFFIINNNNYEKIRTSKGIIRVDKIFKEQIKELIEHLALISNKDKVLILPEGVIINYLTDKQTDDYLFYLIPPNVEIFKEELIKRRIESGQYRYIIISNQLYPWFKETSFIRGWGKDIYSYIKTKYTLKEVIGKDFKFFVYEWNKFYM